MQASKMPGIWRAVAESLNRRRRGGEEVAEGETDAGFTLIELMVVLLIMAILLAIAIPTFLGVKGGAQDKAAQSNLNTALTSAKALYANNGSYLPATAMVTTLGSQEPELTFSTGAVTPGANISVWTSSDGNVLVLVAASQSGACWAVVDNSSTSAETNVAGVASLKPGDSYTGWKDANTCDASALGAATTGAQYQAGPGFPATPYTTGY